MRTLTTFILIFLLVGITRVMCAQSNPKELSYTSRVIARKVRDAKTAQDFEEIARYYDAQAKQFWKLAAQQRHEKEFYQTHDGGKQYPLASERARQLREYYDGRAKESEALAGRYRAHAHALTPAPDVQASQPLSSPTK